MRTTILLALAAFLLSLTGCAWAPTIGADYDTAVDFGRWRRWAWAPQPVGKATASLYDTRIRRSAEAAMAERGYQLVEPDDAEFLLLYRVQITNQQEVTVWDTPGAGYRWRRTYSPAHATVHNYKVGTCVMSIVQVASGHLVWQGWAEAEVHDSTSPELRDERIDKAIRMTLAQFPPQ